MQKKSEASFMNIMDNPQDYLFCYKSEKTSIYSLVGLNLRFSPIGVLNDPIENTLQTFFLDTDDRFTVQEVEKYSTLLKEHTKKYCEEFTKVLCFTLADKSSEQTLISQSHMGYMRFSMWSQYADSGRGACLIFDKNKLDKNFLSLLEKENIFGKSDQIEYTEDFAHGMAFRFMYDELRALNDGENIFKEKVNKYYREYFFKKRHDWSNEKEYRYLIISDRVHNLDISQSIAGIVFGYHASKEFISLINKLDHLQDVQKVKIVLQGFHAYIEGV